jgi:hypothetical protein
MGEGPERSDDVRDLRAVVEALLDLGAGWALTVLPSGQLALVENRSSEPLTGQILIASDLERG